MDNEIKVSFGKVEEGQKKYVVIVSRYMNKWVYVRDKERTTYEIPGGRIECGEDIFQAAKRELFEETGAVDYTLEYVCDYAVEREDIKSWGSLFFARIKALSPLPDYEIVELVLLDNPPLALTYPKIQPHLHDKVQKWLPIQSGKTKL